MIGMIAMGVAGIGFLFHTPQADEAVAPGAAPSKPPVRQVADKEARFAEERREMVERQLRRRDIADRRVLDVMARVPRHRFVPEEAQDVAYADCALPIARDQTISQPYIVALMTQAARPTAQSRALEIGTGSGYQAAVLAELSKEVYTIEIHQSLAESARERLAALGYQNITVRHGDGYQGWRELAPFDLILVTAAPDHVPPALIEQLAIGGCMVIPVGSNYQELLVIEKQANGEVHRREIAPVLFVPMTGEAQTRHR